VKTRSRAWPKIAALALCQFAFATIVDAHPDLQDAMWVQFEPDGVRVAVNVSLKEMSVAQGLDPGLRPESAEFAVAAQKHGEYLLKHLSFTAQGRILAGRVIKATAPGEIFEPEQTFCQYELAYRITAPPEIEIFQDMLSEWPYALGTPWNVSYIVRAKSQASQEITTLLLPRAQSVFITSPSTVDGANFVPERTANKIRIFRDYLWHGVVHILTGYDHLLFIAALVIATSSLWEMVKVIAAFSMAHTITLALCVFGLVNLPPLLVEPLIALSIVVVAVENILWPGLTHSGLRLGVAFGFGLVHGLGFAGALLDAMEGLAPASLWVALLAFSLGVEIGNQAVVLPLFGLLTLGRRRRLNRLAPLLGRYGFAAIACCGLYFLVVAVQQQFFRQ
jgi:hypothetical protein